VAIIGAVAEGATTTTRWIPSLLALLVAGCAASMTGDHHSEWIRVPQTLDRKEVLWEGPLLLFSMGSTSAVILTQKLIPEEELREYQKAHGILATGYLMGYVDDATLEVLDNIWKKVEINPPIISIGRPKTWPSPTVLPPENMSPLIQTRLKEADSKLATTSFTPVRNEADLIQRREHLAVPHVVPF
jgi:hypothetical protein